jgi:hypothetical protein
VRTAAIHRADAATSTSRDAHRDAAHADDFARFERDELDVQAGAGQHLERPEGIDLVEPVEDHDLDPHAVTISRSPIVQLWVA